MRDTRLLVLVSVAAGPRHGYGIQRDLEACFGYRPGPGTLYGAISALEEAGLIEADHPVGRRRPYRLTPAGRRELERRVIELRSVVQAAVPRLAARSGGGAALDGATT